MSHHLDSPLARRDPRLNITDHYVFDDGDGTAFVMNVRTSLAGDAVPDGFHPEGRYETRIHLDGRAQESVTFRWVFGPLEGNGQSYRVFRIDGSEARGDSAIGVEIARGRTGSGTTDGQGLRTWAGRAPDPFFLDLKQLGAVHTVVQHGQDAQLQAGTAANTFAGSTVHSIVLRVPHTDTEMFGGRHVRVWSRTVLATDAGGWHQTGRAGLPMIWPIFRDAEGEGASRANETHPADDEHNYGKSLREAVAETVRLLGTSDRPEAHAERVVQQLVPDTLPYRVGSPAVFGFGGFNGRRLSDNAPEVMFSLVTNSAVPTGLRGVASGEFPYVTG